jgi:phosphatidylinositol phospholipase C delta
MISAKFVKGEHYMPWEIQSLDEKAIVSATQKMGRQFWLNHHQRNLTRVYPKGSRFDSSNYNPLPGWAVGA